jgi:hypothetical protein
MDKLDQVSLRGMTSRWKHLFIIPLAAVFITLSCSAAITWYVPNPSYSIARNWNERILEGIRMDTPHPPVHARNLFSFSVCMYDAWAAYDTNAVGFVYRGKHTAVDVAAARREAISYATYRMMLERHAYSRTATNQASANPNFMAALGYDTNNVSRDTSTTMFHAIHPRRLASAIAFTTRSPRGSSMTGRDKPTARPIQLPIRPALCIRIIPWATRAGMRF